MFFRRRNEKNKDLEKTSSENAHSTMDKTETDENLKMKNCIKNIGKMPKTEKVDNTKLGNVYATINKTKKRKEKNRNENDMDETIMCENDDLYEESIKVKDDVKGTDDDEVIMCENDDLYDVNNNNTNVEKNDIKNDTKDEVIMVENDELYGVNTNFDDAEKNNHEVEDAENDDVIMEENTDLYEESNLGQNKDVTNKFNPGDFQVGIEEPVEGPNKDLSNPKHNRHNYVNVRQTKDGDIRGFLKLH